MRAYHFVSAEHGLSNVKLRRLKIARLADLNDPFEGLAIALPDSASRKAWRESLHEMNAKFGLLCFSRNWSNPVQWSHYADRHKGICLGFDIPDDVTMEVIYRRRPHDSALLDRLLVAGHMNEAQEILLKIMRTKFDHWRYEQEVRIPTSVDVADAESGLHFVGFSPRLELREVIVGHRSTVTKLQLADVLGDLASSVATMKARLAFQTYRVVRQRDQRFWD
ncbi:DUF2971 domain-containing protein [Phenylobacterium sp.]|uniref:DUF2971 domain-containing protein n=1 Tax=Phenylobacterium sp. TaxID=1871053 RepID=UPI003D27F12C